MSSLETSFFPINSEPTLLFSLPSINLSFDEMKGKMAKFTVKFDKFIMNMREKQLEEKNRFLKAITADREIQKNLQKQIENYKNIGKDALLAIEKEKQEIIEAERSIAEFSEKKVMMTEKKKHLSQQIQDINQIIQKKPRANTRHMLIKQASRNQPELKFWEDYLAMRIEGVKDDFLKIIFTHIDENDWTREFYFIINLSQRDYEITECSPQLVTIHEIVSKLNHSRDFFGFLKDIRKAFKNYEKYDVRKMSCLNPGFRTYRLLRSSLFFSTFRTVVFPTSLLQKVPGRWINQYPIISLPIKSSKKKILIYALAGISVWVLVLELSFNHQRSVSPIVSHLIYELKHNSAVQKYLGENIDFIGRWPWISGEINYLKGCIDLSFRICGSQDKATVKFKSIRRKRNSEWVVVEWGICPDKNHQEISLLDE
ncbi:hypothetical protein PCANB_000294 [Pneumocystis canis]|nr:hypothetical protein PCANB_000294 [Pneumocystis canis]